MRLPLARRAAPADLPEQAGSYHYVSGVDASSSAALAAYINSLSYELPPPATWLASPYHVVQGTYCCFNAFSRIDVRVEVRIPGGVNAYVVDLRGVRHAPSPEVWQEVYLSALLRSIHYADDPNYRLSGYRKLDPISSPEDEHRFVQAAENLFFQGWQLGSDPEIQVATVVKNHLAQGIFKYFGQANRMELAVNLFEKLYAREPECATLVAQAYLLMNEEIKAVAVMHEALLKPLRQEGGMPSESYALLHVQADFLRSRGELEWARQLATAAVKCAPSEFLTWAKLTQSLIDLENWEDALNTLNSCPMFTFNELDLHRMPPPARTHLPIKKFVVDSGLLAEDVASNPALIGAGAPSPASGAGEADLALLRLPAPALKGTFARAYSLLTELVSKIGWDELLKRRSNVFFMEEEYRAQKRAELPDAASEVEAKDYIKSQEDNSGAEVERLAPNERSIPTIKISSESDPGDAAPPKESFDADVPSISRPLAVRQDEQEGEESQDSHAAKARPADPSEKEHNPSYALSNRRLCERWLDNLFMVLYEDLRVYTIWRAEMEHYLNLRRPYVKTSLEWEILGDLAMRLHHAAEAKDAYLRCLDVSGSAPHGVGSPGHWSAGLGGAVGSATALPSAATVQQTQGFRFSAKAHLALLDMFTKERDVKSAVWLAVKLTAYNHRWYAEGSYPSAVGHALFSLIQTDGLAKVSYTLVSLSPPKAILRVMQNYFAYAQLFRVPGYDF